MCEVLEVDTKIEDLKLLKPPRFVDSRGYFEETFNYKKVNEVGLRLEFVQDNQVFSKIEGTLRGLHFQFGAFAQAKLVRCSLGKIFDVAVDLRRDSSTFGQWFGVELSDENGLQLFIPEGFAHGYYTLTPETIVNYKCSRFYQPSSEFNLLWCDPDINIDWPVVGEPILSDKDKGALTLKQLHSVIFSNG